MANSRPFSVARLVPGVALLALASSVTLGAGPADPVLYRIFLSGGDTLTSYGDFARVGDRVVFSLPVARLTRNALQHRTQLMSIPSGVVDWPTTDSYAESARYAHYAATRGEADFTALSADVAQALNAIARPGDPERQLAIAQATRHRLVTWTQGNYGYREHDIRQIVTLLDEAVSGLRPETGDGAFNLSFVAMTARPPRMPLRSKPSLQEIIAQALTAARLTPVPAERVSALRMVVGLLDEADTARYVPGEWALAIRREARDALDATLRTERDYRELADWSLERATAYAERADVRGVQSVLQAVRERDEALSHRRPNQVAAVLAGIDTKLADAQQLQLARDRWRLHVGVYRGYRDQIDDSLESFGRQRSSLEDIQLLAGPDTGRLRELQEALRVLSNTLARTYPPAELHPVHELFSRAMMLAYTAADTRQRAVRDGDLGAARNAAAAASGALMLFERAHEQLDRALEFPELVP